MFERGSTAYNILGLVSLVFVLLVIFLTCWFSFIALIMYLKPTKSTRDALIEIFFVDIFNAVAWPFKAINYFFKKSLILWFKLNYTNFKNFLIFLYNKDWSLVYKKKKHYIKKVFLKNLKKEVWGERSGDTDVIVVDRKWKYVYVNDDVTNNRLDFIIAALKKYIGALIAKIYFCIYGLLYPFLYFTKVIIIFFFTNKLSKFFYKCIWIVLKFLMKAFVLILLFLYYMCFYDTFYIYLSHLKNRLSKSKNWAIYFTYWDIYTDDGFLETDFGAWDNYVVLYWQRKRKKWDVVTQKMNDPNYTWPFLLGENTEIKREIFLDWLQWNYVYYIVEWRLTLAEELEEAFEDLMYVHALLKYFGDPERITQIYADKFMFWWYRKFQYKFFYWEEKRNWKDIKNLAMALNYLKVYSTIFALYRIVRDTSLYIYFFFSYIIEKKLYSVITWFKLLIFNVIVYYFFNFAIAIRMRYGWFWEHKWKKREVMEKEIKAIIYGWFLSFLRFFGYKNLKRMYLIARPILIAKTILGSKYFWYSTKHNYGFLVARKFLDFFLIITSKTVKLKEPLLIVLSLFTAYYILKFLGFNIGIIIFEYYDKIQFAKYDRLQNIFRFSWRWNPIFQAYIRDVFNIYYRIVRYFLLWFRTENNYSVPKRLIFWLYDGLSPAFFRDNEYYTKDHRKRMSAGLKKYLFDFWNGFYRFDDAKSYVNLNHAKKSNLKLLRDSIDYFHSYENNYSKRKVFRFKNHCYFFNDLSRDEKQPLIRINWWHRLVLNPKTGQWHHRLASSFNVESGIAMGDGIFNLSTPYRPNYMLVDKDFWYERVIGDTGVNRIRIRNIVKKIILNGENIKLPQFFFENKRYIIEKETRHFFRTVQFRIRDLKEYPLNVPLEWKPRLNSTKRGYVGGFRIVNNKFEIYYN